MRLTHVVTELLEAFERTETDSTRGPAFVSVALELETQMRSGGVSDGDLVECFGRPDLFLGDADGRRDLLYVFDHDHPGANRDEWFFGFERGVLVDSGYNRRGINDVSAWTDGSEFPD